MGRIGGTKMGYQSVLLRGLGVVLILVGLAGFGTGIYAVKLVGGYTEQIKPGTLGLETSLMDMSSTLRNRKVDFESSIEETRGSLSEASSSVESASGDVSSASTSVDKASKNLTTASSELSQSGELNAQAGDHLKGASEGLSSWADRYESGGSPLPEKALFKEATENISRASAKLKESGARTKAAAGNLGETASRLNETASELRKTSDELNKVSDKLEDTGSSISKLKQPISSLLSDLITPLESSTRSVKLINNSASDAKGLLYLVLGYFLVIHLVFIGLGIALIAIEANLSYMA